MINAHDEIIGVFIGMILLGDVLAAYLMAFPGAAFGPIISYQIARNAEPIKQNYQWMISAKK